MHYILITKKFISLQLLTNYKIKILGGGKK